MAWGKNSKVMLISYRCQGNYVCLTMAQFKSLNLNPQIVPQSKFHKLKLPNKKLNLNKEDEHLNSQEDKIEDVCCCYCKLNLAGVGKGDHKTII